MYLKSLEIENYGPLPLINYNFPFAANEMPKPVVFVGQNGSGKSIILSHLVNAMLIAKDAAFTDAEVEKGKVYKFRSPLYVSHGSQFSFTELKFSDDFTVAEIQLIGSRENVEEQFGLTSVKPLWNAISPKEGSILHTNFYADPKKIEEILSRFTLLHFPANRFEEPAWLNRENLLNNVNYLQLTRTTGASNRHVINYSPLRENQNWLLDVIYDRFGVEHTVQMIPIGLPGNSFPVFAQTNGPATKLLHEIERFIKTLLQREGSVRWSVGGRGRRQIGISIDDVNVTSNLFSLSTGQTGLLNIFLTLVRDHDVATGNFTSLSDIRGLAIIDEVDLHLHTELQHTILPNLISLFPRVQFILASHSPLFILGLQKVLGQDGFDVVELPSGKSISVERFAEFEKAYSFLKESVRYENDVREAITQSQKPLIFVEGSIDIDYLQRAAELLGRNASFATAGLRDANGYGGLDKIWKYFDGPMSALINQNVTLLYDCDINKHNEKKPGVRRFRFPLQQGKIKTGIENLFPDSLFERARAAKPEFFDISPGYQKFIRGQPVDVQEEWQLNRDEKRNLADWIIANGTSEEFSAFTRVFDMIDEE
ncbi:AAA family ATPase [Rhizobium sp. ZPR3]|uniref:AAA family ATPase n=2 Tax=unclassified Rhizobium TaxID=2613769 RepID=A0AAU7S940_9HYPH